MGFLVILVIAGIVAVKWSRTTRGLAFLLDHGFGDYYEQVQEDVDILGLSFLAGDHLVLAPKVVRKLQEAGRQDLPVVIGGIILKRHIPELIKLGVHHVFVPGTSLEEIVNHFKKI